MAITDPDARIAAYLAGFASPEEEHELRHWVDADPAHSARFEAAYEAWERLRQHPGWYQPDEATGWAAIQARLPLKPSPRPARRRRWGVGGGLLLAVLAAGLWWGWPAAASRHGAYTGPWPDGGFVYTRPGDSLAATFDRQGSLWLRGEAVLDLRPAGRVALRLRAPWRELSVEGGLLWWRQEATGWELALLAGTATVTVAEEHFVLSAGTRLYTPAGGTLVYKAPLPADFCPDTLWRPDLCPAAASAPAP